VRPKRGVLVVDMPPGCAGPLLQMGNTVRMTIAPHRDVLGQLWWYGGVTHMPARTQARALSLTQTH